MKIRTRFNLTLLLVFVPGSIASIWVTHQILVQNAKSDVLAAADLIMETASSVRNYTIEQVRPNIREDHKEFLPQTVPAFAATEVFNRLSEQHPDYSYREATLNPTNLRDLATEWEKYNVIYKFRSRNIQQLDGEFIDTNGNTFLYLARPIKITNQACLNCHDSAKNAPPALVAKYGEENGFGWQLGEVVGAQIVKIPATLAMAKAHQAVLILASLIIVLTTILFIVLNLVLHRVVISPVQTVSSKSDEISLGNLDIPEFKESGATEIRQLKASFNRMRRSIEKAITILKADASQR